MIKMKEMKINRIWEMPNSRTFKIRAIRRLILSYVKEGDKVLDDYHKNNDLRKNKWRSK